MRTAAPLLQRKVADCLGACGSRRRLQSSDCTWPAYDRPTLWPSYDHQVLALQPDSAKALYRRGVAHTELLRFAEARADLLHACKLEPSSREIREQFDRTKAAHAEAKAADRSAFGVVLG